LVLLILAIIWAAVLIPPALRARAEGRPADSITAFHQQLAVLRRAGPRSGRSPNGPPPRGGVPQRHVALVDAPPVARPVARPPWNGARSISARRNARRRRRDVLMALLVAAGTTFVLGAVPALRMLWLVHVVADVLLIGYVALLVRQRNLATERALKVRLLPTAHRREAVLDGEGPWVVRSPQGGRLDTDRGWLTPEPALLRRSAT
jgi:hypothetical protein